MLLDAILSNNNSKLSKIYFIKVINVIIKEGKLIIIDARPPNSALANFAKGGGTENKRILYV